MAKRNLQYPQKNYNLILLFYTQMLTVYLKLLIVVEGSLLVKASGEFPKKLALSVWLS